MQMKLCDSRRSCGAKGQLTIRFWKKKCFLWELSSLEKATTNVNAICGVKQKASALFDTLSLSALSVSALSVSALSVSALRNNSRFSRRQNLDFPLNANTPILFQITFSIWLALGRFGSRLDVSDCAWAFRLPFCYFFIKSYTFPSRVTLVTLSALVFRRLALVRYLSTFIVCAFRQNLEDLKDSPNNVRQRD